MYKIMIMQKHSQFLVIALTPRLSLGAILQLSFFTLQPAVPVPLPNIRRTRTFIPHGNNGLVPVLILSSMG